MRIAFWQHGAAFALMVADVVIRARRSQILLPMPFQRALVINTCADAASAVTPGRVGGDPVRFVALRRANHSPASIIRLCGSEIAADAVSLVLIGVLLSLAYPAVERQFAASLVETVRSGRGWVAAGIVAAGLSWVISRRFFPGVAANVVASIQGAWREGRDQPAGTMACATALTIAALVARCGILPVLLAGVPGLTLGAVLVGSALLVYGQQLAPTPGGIGAVEIGAVAGFSGIFPSGALALIVVIWRTYALILGSVAGGVLLLRERRMGRRVEAPA